MESNPPVHYSFDPVSQSVLNGVRNMHMSHDILNNVITSASHVVSQATEAGRSSARGSLNYEQFMQGILLPDETMLLSGQYLYYTQVEFSYIQLQYGTPPAKSQMTKGRVFITNRRMLFLSAEEYQGMSINTTGLVGADIKPQMYHLKSQSSDVLHYQTIPLSHLKSLELHTSTGVTTDTNIHSVRPGCFLRACGLLRCFGCECIQCLKSWYHDPPITSTLNLRKLVFGALLPPWDHRGTVTIHLHPIFDMRVVRDFIAELQRFTPGLQCLPANTK